VTGRSGTADKGGTGADAATVFGAGLRVAAGRGARLVGAVGLALVAFLGAGDAGVGTGRLVVVLRAVAVAAAVFFVRVGVGSTTAGALFVGGVSGDFARAVRAALRGGFPPAGLVTSSMVRPPWWASVARLGQQNPHEAALVE
jgi:hypothetical protein